MKSIRGKYKNPSSGVTLIVDTEPEAILVEVIAPFRRRPQQAANESGQLIHQIHHAHRRYTQSLGRELLSSTGFERDSTNERWTDHGEAFVSCWILRHPDSDALESVRRIIETFAAREELLAA